MFRNITPVVQNLLLINVSVFIVANYVFPLINDWFALYNIQSPYFQPFQFLTYMFMHAGFWHLFTNMLGLFVFGPLLEQFLGPKKLLILWMVCGVGAGVLYSGFSLYEYKSLEEKVLAFEGNPDPEYFNKLMIETGVIRSPEIEKLVDRYSRNPDDPMYVSMAEGYLKEILRYSGDVPMVGASGALFGILVAFAMLFPNTQIFLLFPPMPVKAKYLVGAYALYTIYNVLLNSQTDNVAHFAHLSGLLIGAVLVYNWKKDRNSFY